MCLRSFCLAFACTSCACMGFPPQSKGMSTRSSGDVVCRCGCEGELCLAADMLANYPGCIFVSWPVTAGIDSSPSATLKLDKWLKRWMSGKCFRIYILFPLLFFPEAVNERVDMCVLCAAFFLVLWINKKVLQHMFTVIQQQRPCRKCEDFLFFLFFFYLC